jgi:hypothetical protein
MEKGSQEFTIKFEGIKLSAEHTARVESALQSAALAVIGEFIGVDQDIYKTGGNIRIKNMPWPGKLIDVQQFALGE